MKTCSCCNASKSLDQFGIDKQAKQGRRVYCKDCDKTRAKARRQTPKGRFTTYRTGARRRGYSFDLSFKEFMSYWQNPCEYCGDSIDTIGLDRVDNDQGYNTNNVVSCCSVCNRAKDTMGQADFLIWIEKVYNHSLK
jgi:5-methylcytosine-specific restriction endonuclease McrA